MKIEVYNLIGKKTQEIDLDKNVFGEKVNHDLIYEVTIALASNKRRGTAHTKLRSEVRGGGRKPWRQKGTGNARAGSIRSPIFRGGGVTFGPRNERNYQKKVNDKVKKKAFLSVLSSKVVDKEIRVFEKFDLEKPSTKKLVKLFEKLETKDKSVLIVSKDKQENLKNSIRNIKKTTYRMAKDISSLDLLNHKYFYVDKEAVDYYNDKYSKSKKKSKKTVSAKKQSVKSE